MAKLEPYDLSMIPTNLFLDYWLLLTAGDMRHYNAMTIGWGSVGLMWEKPFIQVVVRPVRYTYEFMNRYPTFTVCAFSEKYQVALNLLGTTSGRDGDKIAAAGLTVIPSEVVAAPGFREAELVLECSKIYWQDLEPRNFLEATIAEHYPNRDYHRLYFGEIVHVGRPQGE